MADFVDGVNLDLNLDPNLDLGSGAQRLSVRPAVSTDIPMMARLQAASIAGTVAAVLGAEAGARVQEGISESEIALTWQQALNQPLAETQGILVAQEDDDPVGFTAFIAQEAPEDEDGGAVPLNSAQILAFEVAEGKQRQGHGSRMLTAVADFARDAELPGMVVWIVGEDEARVKFFQESGFAPAGARRTLDTGAGPVTEHLWFTLF